MTHLEVLSDLTNKPLEGQLADEELRRLLVATDFTEGDGTRPETMRLLDTTSRGLNAQGRMSRGDLDVSDREGHVPEPSCAQPWPRAAYAGPCHQWTYERSAWYEPLLRMC